MVIIEIFPDCAGNPIRLLCAGGSLLADCTFIAVGNDYASLDVPRYFLHIRCRETHVDGVLHLHGLHNGTDTEGGGISLAENRDAFCINHERCPLRLLTVEELLFPLFSNQLTPNQTPVQSHRYN